MTIKTLAKVAAVAAMSCLPLSASALSYFSGGVEPGETYSFSDGSSRVVASAIADEAAGSFSFDVTNDQSSTWVLNFGQQYFNNSLPGGTISFGSSIAGATAPFSVALAAGQTETLTVFYSDLVRGDVFGARFSAVPLPAGALLLLSALGLAGVARGRKSTKA